MAVVAIIAIMDIMTAKEAKNKFGQLLSSAQLNPVEIHKHGSPVAIILSADEYHRLEQIEDNYWLAQAKNAEENGFISYSESEDLLTEILDESN